MTPPQLVLLKLDPDTTDELPCRERDDPAGIPHSALSCSEYAAILEKLAAVEGRLRDLDHRLDVLYALATDPTIELTIRRPRTAAPAATHLIVGDGCRWFASANAGRVDLGRRFALRRVLSALVEARDETPGRELSCEALLASGWPNERVLPHAGSARVRSAVAELRRLGLRDVLVKGEHGYLLDPRTPLEQACS